MHANSLAAYQAGNLEAFPQRAQMILGALAELGRATDRQVCERLGFADMNACRPRISELIAAGVIEECGDILDPLTKRPVRVVRIVSKQTEFGFVAA
jgi:DNA-binding Lrp family transcriptional regulator